MADPPAADQPATEPLDVAIVSYRCRELLRDCLRSLQEHPPARGLRVHVVDNASADGSVEMVRAEFPWARLTASDRNLGFSTANNIVLRERGGPYVLVLNPDTRLTAGALDRLLDAIEGDPRIAVCGPRLELEDGTLDHAAKRSFPTPLGALAHFSGLGRRAGAPERLAQYRAPRLADDVAGPVDAVNGAFMLIRREALEEVGLFDEGYWMYMEDLDLSYRLAKAGRLSWYEPSATVVHVKSGSAGQARSARLERAFHYGMYRFYRKHYAPDRSPVVNAVIYLGIAVKLALSLCAGAARRAARRFAPVRPSDLSQ